MAGHSWPALGLTRGRRFITCATHDGDRSSAMSDELLSVRRWRVSRSGVVDIGPLDLDLRRGTITTVMGPSGIGKTTLLLSLLGATEAGVLISGERHQNGRVLTTGEILREALYIPQRVPFNPNWEIGRYLARLPFATGYGEREPTRTRFARDRRVAEVLTDLRLNHRARATLAELSGG